MPNFTGHADIIDSRDIIDCIDELEGDREGWEPNDAGVRSWEDENPDDAALLALALAFRDEAEDMDDWPHGLTLIHEDHFTEYAQQLAEDIGAIDRDATWPSQYIDWDAAADALRHDYTAFDIDGTTYYCR